MSGQYIDPRDRLQHHRAMVRGRVRGRRPRIAPSLRSADVRSSVRHFRFCRTPRRSSLASIDAPTGLIPTRFSRVPTYLSTMRRVEFAPCLPTRKTSVPAGPDWIHEVKHDGYRLTVHREGKRVRLFTRNGHDWSDRYPLIVEAALRVRIGSFVLDGEAVLLGVDGRSDFDGLHSRQYNDEVSSTPSTC